MRLLEALRAEGADLIDVFNTQAAGYLPELLGLRMLSAEPARLRSTLEIRQDLMAPNDYLHAATVIALADTTCGYGTLLNLPPQARGFTTIELKSNFVGTARDGSIQCEAMPHHLGRSTQVWDARVYHEPSNRAIALFRCTQLILQ
jgi:uncharacterized protein (TIGR00369 family)